MKLVPNRILFIVILIIVDVLFEFFSIPNRFVGIFCSCKQKQTPFPFFEVKTIIFLLSFKKIASTISINTSTVSQHH